MSAGLQAFVDLPDYYVDWCCIYSISDLITIFFLTVTSTAGTVSCVKYYIGDENFPHAAYFVMLDRGH